VDIDDNALRLKKAPLLAVGSAAREVAEIEPLPRDDIKARQKLIAEAGLTEIKTFLGWLLDFRWMTISLPDSKFHAYSIAISGMLKQGWTSKGELETNIGRWVHLGQIVPTVHHFLSRLRFLKQRAENRLQITINKQCKEDLLFLLFVLGKCHQGINLNLIAFRQPTHVYRSDSCLDGLGGYSHEGFGWRFYLPNNLKFRASNNLLEHLTAIITLWIEIIAGRLKKGDCALLMTNSTTSEGWLQKSNFIEDGKDPIQATIRLEVAHLHATHYLSNEIREYSQWFRGADNNVADTLSRDNNRTDDELTQILRSHCPSQLPQHFEIVPLPNKIVSWLTSLLLRLPAKQQLVETHSTTKLGCGIVTQSTAKALDSETTISLKTCPEPTKSKSSEVSPWLCVKGDFLDHVMLPWLKAQSQIPSTMWLRSSGKMGTTTPNGMPSATLHDFYGIN
jgi:hypothetical protein